VRTLARRAPFPVKLRGFMPDRLDGTIEAAAYFCVSEALTNIAKYSQATSVSVDLEHAGSRLLVTISDDGIGGADPARGSGPRGLADRVQAVGGRLEVTSPPGTGTRLHAELPTNVLGPLDGA
jgi:signal transduction histidine kinase